jgi:hypothetical protein
MRASSLFGVRFVLAGHFGLSDHVIRKNTVKFSSCSYALRQQALRQLTETSAAVGLFDIRTKSQSGTAFQSLHLNESSALHLSHQERIVHLFI